MTTLHVYFAQRNQQAFQRLLDASRPTQSSGAPPSSSGSKSWTKRSPLSSKCSNNVCEVNSRDQLGRTVLHLAVSSLDPAAFECVKLLLAHPRIDVNVTDKESKWTSLHRALYYGNVPAAVFLLQRADIDPTIKDLEGYTAFDVYNSTVEGTKPCERGHNELFVWGSNRNAALGVGDGDDRSFPEQVPMSLQKEHSDSREKNIYSRFFPICIEDVVMSKLHTAVITSESRSNIRICGFGSGGRLGGGALQHTQYSFTIPKDLPSDYPFIAIALGQDHTLALNSAGAIYSWGLPRFSQLGYTLEGGGTVQATPRRIVGPLKREFVRGIAACRTASACWTDLELLTWGTNSGQLGYDRVSTPTQVLPRRVTQIVQPVVDVALSDSAMAVLVRSKDVHCFCEGRSFKINFPTQYFPSEIQTYRPPMAQNNASIAKVICCDNSFAALSSNGEVFSLNFNLSPALSEESEAPKKSNSSSLVKVQRIWTLRKQFSAARDVALGTDGTIIICTESGHVYTKGRASKSAKFTRIPSLQRIVGVSASSAGSIAALRSESTPTPIQILGNSLSQDLEHVQPFLGVERPEVNALCEAKPLSDEHHAESTPSQSDDENLEDDDTQEDSSIKKDISILRELLELLHRDSELRKVKGEGIYDSLDLKHGADLFIEVDSGFTYPVHRTILSSRSKGFMEALMGKHIADDKLQIYLKRSNVKLPVLSLTGVHPLSALLLSVYLYSDSMPTIWDRRVQMSIAHLLLACTPKMNVESIRKELKALASCLDLPALTTVLEVPVKRAPKRTLGDNFSAIFYEAQSTGNDRQIITAKQLYFPLVADTSLELADKTVFCHSLVLRARSPFFASFFDDTDWTCKRWTQEHTISLKFPHMRWQVVEFAMKFIYYDPGTELIDVLEGTRTIDDVIDFIFEVMNVASEFLLDRLTLICSCVILKFININNACSLLSEATFYSASHLIQSILGYISQNMESLLERSAFDSLPIGLLREISNFVRNCQSKKLPVTRSGKFIDDALQRWKEWLSEQDIPQPIIPRCRVNSGHIRDSPKLSPLIIATDSKSSGTRPIETGEPYTPSKSQMVQVRNVGASRSPSLKGKNGTDDIFEMDDLDGEIPYMKLPGSQLSSNLATPQDDGPSIPTSASSVPWKNQSSKATTSKLDLRAIMAEAEVQRFSSASAIYSPGRTMQVSSPSASGSTSGASQRRTKQDLKPSKSDSPWRTLPAERSSPPTSLPKQMSKASDDVTGKDGAREGTAGGSRSSKLKQDVPIVQGSPSSTKGKAPLGPTFSPAKQQSSVSASQIMRRVSDGQNKAWNSPMLAGTEEPSSFSNANAPTSFLAIQQQQLNAYSSSARSKPKSLREIQEEEQVRAEEARAAQEEAEFLCWWAEEEERIRRETMAPPAPRAPGLGSKGKKKSGGEKKKSRTSQENKGTGEKSKPKQEQKNKSNSNTAATSGGSSGSGNGSSDKPNNRPRKWKPRNPEGKSTEKNEPRQ